VTRIERKQASGQFGTWDLPVEGIWGTFAENNFWIKNLNKTPLNFLKQSSQVNNFTVFFQIFHWNVKKCVFNMLGLLRNSPYKQIWFGKLEN